MYRKLKMSEQVRCKDCKHSFRTIGSFIVFGSGKYAWKCRRSFIPAYTEFDPVTGPKKIKGGYDGCSIARIGNDRLNELAPNRCGESGRFWEPKHKTGLFTFIKHVSAE